MRNPERDRQIVKKRGYVPKHGREARDDGESGVRLYQYNYGHCDPKRCSGQKLVRHGLVSELPFSQSFPGILLAPDARVTISPADYNIIERCGLATIDASWRRILEDGNVNLSRVRGRNRRLLPFLYAGNTVNYGAAQKLNCAEATAAALYISGHREQAHKVMSLFSYADAFFYLNETLLEAYAKCHNSDEIRECERRFMEAREQRMAEQDSRRERAGDDDFLSAWDRGNPNHRGEYSENETESEDDTSESEDHSDQRGASEGDYEGSDVQFSADSSKSE